MIHSGTFQVERTADEVFDLLATPERFAPLMPDFESMAMQDATHFSLRTVIHVGPMLGHANLAMELRDAVRPVTVRYSGQAILAGSPLRMRLDFRLAAADAATEVSWQGEVNLEGPLAFMAGSLVETMGRENFERMAERLQEDLREQPARVPHEPPGDSSPDSPEYEI